MASGENFASTVGGAVRQGKAKHDWKNQAAGDRHCAEQASISPTQMAKGTEKGNGFHWQAATPNKPSRLQVAMDTTFLSTGRQNKPRQAQLRLCR